ncbi:MAG TPA: phage holin family protein [Candidatus Paceibacterota bacterium]|jgi:putative membrane protein|nr:phage holin family protein [Parcubacteria group bacterium]HOM33184.1 phage holin family protein [Candidatus Paceibacterota bacterium]HPC37243.1 phage holin family protein [Candidatus Paceibacterota bacterium]HRU36056.1 phage holin family protein [Candidatus Paceibacterota bacterium]
MKFLSRLALQILLNALGLWLIIQIVPNVFYQGDVKNLILISIVLGVLNFVLKPIIKLILTPLIVLTLGIFSIIINAFILWLATQLITGLIIPIGWPLLWATLIMSIINSIFTLLTKK